MTRNQQALYWRAWGKARAHLISRDTARSGDVDAMRHKLHLRALGYDKSMIDLNNHEFDHVLAAFWAVSQPSDLEAQLRQQDQPYIRWIYEAHRLLVTIGEVDMRHYMAYLSGLSARVNAGEAELTHLDPAQRRRVIQALSYAARRAARKGHSHTPSHRQTAPAAA